MAPKFCPVSVTDVPGAALDGSAAVMTGGGSGAGAGAPCWSAVTVSWRPPLSYVACASRLAVAGEDPPDGAVTVQDCVFDAPAARSPALTGAAGLTVQPAGAVRLTKTP